ncbi:MAG: hypothetical protein JWL72_2609 [Ilumatobacteraceae bacterium]|nr:hypothetical protein [Ilumatobacteraceae bacterium]
MNQWVVSSRVTATRGFHDAPKGPSEHRGGMSDSVMKRVGRAAVLMALIGMGGACATDKSGVSTKSADQSEQTVAGETTGDQSGATTPPSEPQTTPASSSPVTDAVSDTVSGTAASAATVAVTDPTAVANPLQGTFIVFRRLETANPPFDEFVPGQPDAQQWVLQPQCSSGPCDVDVRPGDNGYVPDGWPDTDDEKRPFTLAMQPDRSYTAHDVVNSHNCSGTDGDVPEGAERSYDYQLTFVPSDDGSVSHLEGGLTVNQVPTAAGIAAGCIEFHDTQSLYAVKAAPWTGSIAQLHFGTYDIGGLVVDGDAYNLAHTGKVGSFVHLNSPLKMDDSCTGDPCEISATGVVPAYGNISGTFTWVDGELVATTKAEDTCVSNETKKVIVQHGYDEVVTFHLTPVVTLGPDVIAWLGTYSEVSTPTAEAVAASAADCTPGFRSLAIAATTTKPYFDGL